MEIRTRYLRALLTSLIALSLAGGVAGPVGAEAQPKKEKLRAKSQIRPSAESGAARYPLPDPYVELNASKMRMGSTAWWEQMRREGRLGGETP